MCGRFTQAQIAELDREIFKLLEIPYLEPRYNVAPTQTAAVVREERDGRSLDLLRWGLIPSWARDASVGNRIINARAESLAQKPAFREPFERRRCLVPADGFYEWQKTAHGKRPHYIRARSGGVLALAGLWDRWLSHDKGPIETFTIVTTKPNAVVEPVHDRMPVILLPEAYDIWLDPDERDTTKLRHLLEPCPDEEVVAYPVSSYVNNVANDGPECVEPIDA